MLELAVVLGLGVLVLGALAVIGLIAKIVLGVLLLPFKLALCLVKGVLLLAGTLVGLALLASGLVLGAVLAVLLLPLWALGSLVFS